jgi:hypothetical protein
VLLASTVVVQQRQRQHRHQLQAQIKEVFVDTDYLTCNQSSHLGGSKCGDSLGRKETQWRQDSDVDDITLASLCSIETMQQNNLSGKGMGINAKHAIDRYLRSMSIRDLVEHLSENTLVEHVRSARTVAVLDQCETIQGRSVDHYNLAAALPFALLGWGSICLKGLMSVGMASLIRRMYPGIDAQVMPWDSHLAMIFSD